MSRITFPRLARPEVSVLMVTFGGWGFVERALRALRDGTPPVYEVIVVDNASPDGLAERLREEVENATIVFNGTNRGFGPANNQAATLARGSALALLNSDAFVHPGWLPPLQEALALPRVASAGPRILNEDGTLQEAGCLLYESAITEFHGFRDVAESFAYAFPRDVDYSSAACVLFDRRAFFTLGGFDAEFAPVFYEDVDLCLRFRQAGLRCVYEPRSVVTHLRGASRSEEASRAMAERNAAVLRERWAPLLRTRPAWRMPAPGDPGEVRRRLAARDAPLDSRVLVVTDSAKDLRVAALLAALVRRRPSCVTTLVSDPPVAPEVAAALRGQGVEVAAPVEPLADWLWARRFHYDVVVLHGAAAWKIAGAPLAASQPQACRIALLAPAAQPVAPLGEALSEGDIVLCGNSAARPLLARLLPRVTIAPWRPGSGNAEATLDAVLAGAGVAPPEEAGPETWIPGPARRTRSTAPG